MSGRPNRTVDDVTDPLQNLLVSVPPAGDGICRFCHGATGAGFPQCASCLKSSRQVKHPVQTIVPISLYAIPSQLHTVLREYKDGRGGEVRSPLVLQVAGLIGRFLRDHRQCIVATTGRDFDTIVPVPSSRPGPHPLEQALRVLVPLRDIVAPVLEVGTAPVDEQRNANDSAFRPREEVAGRKVLVVDDTFVTGARVQSAASALTLAGADVVAALVVGRVIRFNPDYPQNQELWDRMRGKAFSFETCCLS